MKLSQGLVRNYLDVVADPTRTDLVFKVITAPEILKQDLIDKFLDRVRQDPRSQRLISERYERPWKVSELAEYSKDTLGYAYARHMIENNLDADFFDRVPGDSEGAYIQLRMRQTHDIWHTLLGFGTSVPHEIGIQAFQIAQYGTVSSGTIISMLLMHGAAFDSEEMTESTAAIARGFSMGKACRPLFGERFEEHWTRNLAEYRQELGLRI